MKYIFILIVLSICCSCKTVDSNQYSKNFSNQTAQIEGLNDTSIDLDGSEPQIEGLNGTSID